MPGPIIGEGDLVGEGLACRRGGRLVFAGLDFRLPAGGALVLTGSNGSGKSSLLRLLATLLPRPRGGCCGAASRSRPIAARYRAALHYVGHLDAIKPALTRARDAGLLGGAARRGDSGNRRGARRFGLGAVADWPCRWLSAGQRRRLALARLVAAPAPIWLLDEPTAALDGDGEARLMEAIAEHRAAGGRVAVATHQPLAAAGCGRRSRSTISLSRRTTPRIAVVSRHGSAVMAAFLGLFRRDLRLALRQGGDVGLVLGFFVLAVLLFPFGVGPEPELLGRDRRRDHLGRGAARGGAEPRPAVRGRSRRWRARSDRAVAAAARTCRCWPRWRRIGSRPGLPLTRDQPAAGAVRQSRSRGRSRC